MRPLISASIGLALLAGVAPATAFPTLSGAEPQIWAHRGASLFSRENTLEAFDLAKMLGATGYEIDLVLTKDGQLAVFHDETLEVRTNVETVFPGRDREGDGRYFVIDFTMDELRLLDVDAPRDEIIRNAAINPYAVAPDYRFTIPSYAEALDQLAALDGQQMLTEVKIAAEYTEADRAAIIDTLIAEWQARGYVSAASPMVVQSFSETFMTEIADRLDAEGMSVRTYQLNFDMLLRPGAPTDQAGLDAFIDSAFGRYTGLALNMNLFPVDGAPFFGVINPNGLDFVGAAHSAGLEVLVWTLAIPFGADPDDYFAWAFDPAFPVDFAEQYAQLYALGLDGIITDTPDIGVATRAAFAATLTPVPLPAAGWLLLAGLGALAVSRRR